MIGGRERWIWYSWVIGISVVIVRLPRKLFWSRISSSNAYVKICKLNPLQEFRISVVNNINTCLQQTDRGQQFDSPIQLSVYGLPLNQHEWFWPTQLSRLPPPPLPPSQLVHPPTTHPTLFQSQRSPSNCLTLATFRQCFTPWTLNATNSICLSEPFHLWGFVRLA